MMAADHERSQVNQNSHEIVQRDNGDNSAIASQNEIENLISAYTAPMPN